MLGMPPISISTALQAPDSRLEPDRVIHFRAGVRTSNLSPPRRDAAIDQGQLCAALVRKRHTSDKDVCVLALPHEVRCRHCCRRPARGAGADARAGPRAGGGGRAQGVVAAPDPGCRCTKGEGPLDRRQHGPFQGLTRRPSPAVARNRCPCQRLALGTMLKRFPFPSVRGRRPASRHR